MDLIQGRITLISNGYPLNEISVKSLVGYLEAKGVPCRAVYLRAAAQLTEAQRQKVIDLCEGSTVVGFSLMSKDVRTCLPLTAELKARGIPVILGGVHATAMPAETLRQCDFACVGEGELPLYLLYTYLRNSNTAYSEIPNLAYAVNGQPLLPRRFHSEPSLDLLPFPDYEFRDAHMLCGDGQIRQVPATPEERRRFFGMSSFLFYSQRGCPFSCTYCSNSLYHAIARQTAVPWYRRTSPARVKEELRHHLKFLVVRDAISINDDDFVCRPIEEIDEISGFIRHELGLRFSINATPAGVTREKMAVMAKNGLMQIAMGVQTGSTRVLKGVYKRHVYAEQVLKAANIISEFYKDGVVADYGFILENPYEMPEDYRDTIKLFLALPRPFNVSLYSLAFFPGTVLTQRALAENVIKPEDIALDKDYRESIRPSFVHMILEAHYHLKVPDEINAILLSDNVFTSERKKYARMLLANYFCSDAVREITSRSAKSSSGAAQRVGLPAEQEELVGFLSAVAEILKNWSTPERVIQPGRDGEDLILEYADPAADTAEKEIQVGFQKGLIVRLGDSRISASSPADALNGSYRKQARAAVYGKTG